MTSASAAITQAARTSDFINSIGVNTHIDFTWTAYDNLTTVINAIKYLGIANLRDSPDAPADLHVGGLWQTVALATGAKFDAFMPEGSAGAMQTPLTYINGLAGLGILNYLEGGNEEDDATASGNSLAKAAQFQQQVYTLGHSLGLSVINMSYGQGWAHSTTGNYGTVGDQSAYADYANAHTYFGTGNTPGGTIGALNADAQLAASRPVITTEMGWYTTSSTTDASNVSQTVQAKYMLDGLMDAFKAGDVKTYLYELLDENSSTTNTESNFGLFNADGSAKPAALALHDLTTLLADKGSAASTFTAGALRYSLSGLGSTDQSLLLEKSDGSYWLSVWNEARLSGPAKPGDLTVANHTIGLSLGNVASSVIVYDPLLGTTATATYHNVSSVQISLPDHPVLVEIVPTDVAAASGSGPASDGAIASTAAATAAAVTAHDLNVVVPAIETMAAGALVAVAGVSIEDAWAKNHAGAMVLNLTTGSGTLSVTDGAGHAVAGSGSATIHLSGSLDQLNAELSTLSYHASSLGGNDALKVDVWNQGGVEATQSIEMMATSTTSAAASSPRDLYLTLPSAQTIGVGDSFDFTHLQINDAWAQNHAGAMALNLTVSSGTLSMEDAGGHAVSGSGTHALHVSGSFGQLNAELATLSYQAGNAVGADSLHVDVWNQAGIEAMQSIALNVTHLS